MKFKYNEDGKEFTFLRTLNTERQFREETGAEMNAQLGELAYQFETMAEKAEVDPKAVYAGIMDLNFLEARAEVLRFMYAEVDKAGVLVQNERTREHFDALSLDKNAILTTFFRSL